MRISESLVYITPQTSHQQGYDIRGHERDEAAEYGLVSYFDKDTVLQRIDVDAYKLVWWYLSPLWLLLLMLCPFAVTIYALLFAGVC